MPRTKRGLRSLCISEMIAELEDALATYGDLPVVGSCDYGDYCHTQQIITFDTTELHRPVESAYSTSGYAISEDMDEEDDVVESDGEYDGMVLVLR